MSEETGLVKVSEKSITKIPVQALHTFRKDYPTQTVPKNFRILHNFMQIDAAVRYSIMVLIKAGYNVQTEFSVAYRMPYLERNPRYSTNASEFYDDNAKILPWHEIQISPFTKEHHKRSLLLTFQQLGFTTGELQFWLEVQFTDMTRLKREIEKEDRLIQNAWRKKWMRKHAGAKQGSHDYRAWCNYCYKNSPAEYWKHKKKGRFLRFERGQPVYSADWTEFWSSDWYNWRDYLPYWFMPSDWRHTTNWQGRSIYQRHIISQKDKIWFFKCAAGYYVPFLFVNPDLNLVQTEYVLDAEAKEFLQLNRAIFPELPEDIAPPALEKAR